jgi:hypothetical protein
MDRCKNVDAQQDLERSDAHSFEGSKVPLDKAGRQPPASNEIRQGFIPRLDPESGQLQTRTTD